MPMYDRMCQSCGTQQLDLLEKIETPDPQCSCGGVLQRAWINPPGVVADDIPGGIEIRHGLCNEDGSPRRYYSKSEIQREAQKRGFTNVVRHVTDPLKGSDKSKHTSRWV